MKNIQYILLMAGATLALSGCSDFLDSEPITKLVDANFYKTEADADAALTGCYDGLQLIEGTDASGTNFFVSSMIMSDECFGGAGTGDGYGAQAIDAFSQGRSGTDLDIYNEHWIAYYQALYRCNMLLSKMDQIEWKTTDKRNTVEAETRFLRAYLYFEMTRLWGEVPLVTEPLSVKDANVPRTPVDDIYSVIETDLLFACQYAQLNGKTWTKAWAQTDGGHASVYAAKALLARVYLFYTGYYNKDVLPNGTTKEEVTEHLRDVLTVKSGHALYPDFARLWPASCSAVDSSTELGLTTTYAGDANEEIIFAVKFNSTGVWDTGGTVDGNRILCCLSMRTGSFDFTNLPYACTGWGIATVTSDYATDMKSDPRYTPSVIDCDAEHITHLVAKSTQREYTGYFNKKYTFIGTGPGTDLYTLQSLNFQINPYQQFVAIRYADVLLMLSELTQDPQYMNEVRARVGLPGVAYSDEALRQERKFEFAFEGIRYWDLLRYDHTLAYASNAITGEWTVTNSVDDKVIITDERLQRCKGLSQIPQTQIDLSNGILTQNNGWGSNR